MTTFKILSYLIDQEYSTRPQMHDSMTSIKAMESLKNYIYSLLRKSEKYTKTDMVYVASGAFWSNVSYITVSTLSLITSILFARLLSKEDYGMYQYILSITSIIGATSLTGMNNAVTRAVARGHEGEFTRSIKFQLMWGLIPLFAGIAISGWYFFHHNASLSLSFIFVALFLPLANTFNTWVSFIGGRKLFRIGTYYGITNSILTYGGIIAVLYFSRDYVWIIFANFFFAFISNFIIYKLAVRKFKPNNETDGETMKYGSHLSLMAIPGVISSQIDALMIFHFIGPSALAVYSFATLIPEKLAGGLKFIASISLVKFAQRKEHEIQQSLTKKIWLAAGIISIVAIAYAVSAPWFFEILFPKYKDSVIFTQIYSLSLFSVIASIVQTALISQQKVKELYKVNTIMPIFKTILLCVLMYYFSIWGILFAQIISNFVSIPVQLSMFKNKKEITPNSSTI